MCIRDSFRPRPRLKELGVVWRASREDMAAVTFTGLNPFKLTGVRLTKNELGTGSYASVYELNYLGLKCAGKKIHEILLKQGGSDTYALTRFEEECRLLSRMRHPNIVQFLGVYFEKGMQVPILLRQWLESRYRHSKISLREPVAHTFVWGPLTHAH